MLCDPNELAEFHVLRKSSSETCFAMMQIDFVEKLIKEAGVAAVPGCGFFHSNACPSVEQQICDYRERYVRFAFCKSDATLSAAAERLREFSKTIGALREFF